MPHEYLGGETPCEQLTGKPFSYGRLRIWGAECFVYQNQQQRGAGSKFHPYGKRGTVVGHDRLSPRWCVWRMQETKLVESSHITFELEAKILDIVAELKAVSDDEGETSEEEKTAQIDGDGGSGGQSTQDPTSSKSTSPCIVHFASPVGD